MNKRPSIIAQVTEEAPPIVAPPIQRVTKPAAEEATDPGNIVRTSLYITRDAHERLREIAFQKRRRVHSLIVEGIEMLIKEYGFDEKARVKLGRHNWQRRNKGSDNG